MKGTPQEFKITLPITGFVTRSYTDEAGVENNVLVIEGIASDASRDQYNGKMSPECIVGMVEAVNNGKGAPLFNKVSRAEAAGPVGVGMDVDHSDHWTDQIGRAVEARAIYDLTPEMKEAGYEAPLMYVKAEVDLDMSHGRDLQRALQKGTQLGMSIWGFVKDGKVEVNRATGERTEHFNKVDLRKIAITSKPVNKNTWLTEVKRSMTGVEMDEEEITQAEVSRSEDTVAEAQPDMLEQALARAKDAPEEAATPDVSEGNEAEEVVTRSEEQPEAQPEAQPEQPVEETVQRAEEPEHGEEEVVARGGFTPEQGAELYDRLMSVFSAQSRFEEVSRSMSETTEVIRSLPTMFEQVNEEIARSRSTVAELQSTVTTLQEQLNAVTRKLQEREGRKGIIARSESYAPTQPELTEQDIHQVVKKIAATDKVAAMNFLLGRYEPNLPVDSPVDVPQELLSAPDNSPVQ